MNLQMNIVWFQALFFLILFKDGSIDSMIADPFYILYIFLAKPTICMFGFWVLFQFYYPELNICAETLCSASLVPTYPASHFLSPV